MIKNTIICGTYKDVDGDIVICILGFIYMTIYKIHRNNPGVLFTFFNAPK